MGLLSVVGGALGSFFGPVGTAAGAAIGGAIDGKGSSSAGSIFDENMGEPNDPMSGGFDWSSIASGAGKLWDSANRIASSPVFNSGTSAFAANRAYASQMETNAANLAAMREQMSFNASEAEKQRAFSSGEAFQAYGRNLAEANNARAFSQYMSDTQWQRAVGDLEKAGLNPMLAYSKGGNAFSTPGFATSPAASGASASAGGLSRAENAAQAAIGAFATASQAKKTLLELDQVQALTDEVRARTSVHRATESQLRAETDFTVGPRTALTSAQTANVSEDTAVKTQQITESLARVDRIAEQNQLTRAEVAHIKVQTLNAALTGEKLKVEIRNEKAIAQLHELQIPHMKNMSAAESTWFKEKVSPFLPDFLRGSSILQRFRR